jgi:hypothetical protein
MRVGWKVVAGLAGGTLLILAGLAGDRMLSRPDRIRRDEEVLRLRRLQDAILRFTLDREAFPRELAELVPAYASDAMLRFRPSRRSPVEQPVRWDPASGTLEWSVPLRMHGLWSRNADPFRLVLTRRPVIRDPLSGAKVFRQTDARTVLGPEAIIIEPELFQEMTYGWQIEESASASGQACALIKEGVGDIIDHIRAPFVEFDPARRSGDFFNVSGSRERIEACCRFDAPEDGEYFIMARLMPGRSICSNVIRIQVDDQPEFIVGFNRTEPFVWGWQMSGWDTPPGLTLSRGRHTLKLHAYQDGVWVDQVVLSRTKRDWKGVGVVTGGYPQDAARADGAPLSLSLSLDALTVTEAQDPVVCAYVRKTGQAAGQATLQVSLDLPGGRMRVREYPLDLPAEAPLLKFPCPVELPRPLARREYLLRARLLAGGRLVQERTAVLYHGYDWSVLGPLPYLKAEVSCEPEASATPAASYRFGSDVFAWKPYLEEFTGPFGLLDFGRMFNGRSFDAMPKASVYAYTELEVPRAGEYLLKAQGDDHLLVWINGRKAATIVHEHETAIRSAAHFPVRLEAGRNRILFRLNQTIGQWQAGIRFRTADDRVAEVVGVPRAQQQVPWR